MSSPDQLPNATQLPDATQPPASPALTLSRAELEHLARLARLDLKSDQLAPMQREINELLGYFQQLRAVNTTGPDGQEIAPMQRPLPLSPELRADKAGESLPQAVVLALAPATNGDFVSVPRTLETE